MDWILSMTPFDETRLMTPSPVNRRAVLAGIGALALMPRQALG